VLQLRNERSHIERMLEQTEMFQLSRIQSQLIVKSHEEVHREEEDLEGIQEQEEKDEDMDRVK